jgi:hypothetical protein
MINKFIHTAIILILVSASSASSQKNGAEPDRFSQLVLNQTTPDEAFQFLGKVESDKIDRLDGSQLGKWLNAKYKDKIFRKLKFKNTGMLLSTELSFLENTLVMIELEFRKAVKPENLKDIFGVNFADIGGPSPLPDKPGEYPRPFFSTAFPATYYKVGISPKTFLLATCTTSVPEDPGRVEKTRQISRLLEKK